MSFIGSKTEWRKIHIFQSKNVNRKKKQDLRVFNDDNTLKSCFVIVVALFAVVAQSVFFLILH